MNKRNFIKTLAVLTSVFTLKPELSAGTKVDVTVSVTKNCLIELPDGSLNINVYGDYVCLISHVTLPARIAEKSTYFRFATKPFPEKLLTEQDFKTMQKLIECYIDEHKNEGTVVTQFAPTIHFPYWKS